jgi:hypothetical protein
MSNFSSLTAFDHHNSYIWATVEVMPMMVTAVNIYILLTMFQVYSKVFTHFIHLILN